MELTKEHFDQVVSGLASKQDLEKFVTKEDLKTEIEDLAAMVQRGFADLASQLDLREQLAAHEREIHKLKTVVGIS
jgi:hypothetical protein